MVIFWGTGHPAPFVADHLGPPRHPRAARPRGGGGGHGAGRLRCGARQVAHPRGATADGLRSWGDCFFLRVCIDFIWIDGKYMKISHVIENMIWKKR
jgi:hypothetical protein